MRAGAEPPDRRVDGATAAVLVDASSSGAAPGTFHRFDAAEAAVPGRVSDPRPTRSGSERRSSLRGRSAGCRRAWSSTGSRAPRSAGARALAACRGGRGRAAAAAIMTSSNSDEGGRARASADERRDAQDRGGRAADGADRVTRVTVRLGALSHFTPEHFREHFVDASRGTIAEGAEVDAVLDDDVGAPNAAGVVIESVEVEMVETARRPDVPRVDRRPRRGLGRRRRARRPGRRRLRRLAVLRARRACRRPTAPSPRDSGRGARPGSCTRGARARGRRDG